MPNKVIDERRTFLSAELVGRREARLALGAVLVSALVFFVALPFAKIPLMQINAFVPAYELSLIICDLITAALLFGQFNFLQSRALLTLACGYLFTAFIALSHLLSYPDLFSPTGLLGAGPQSTAWLYMFWHAGFPLVIVLYAMLKDEKRPAANMEHPDNRPRRRPGPVILASVAAVLAFVGGLTFVATTLHDSLPVLMQGSHLSSSVRWVVVSVWLLSFLALGALWLRRSHSVLDLWLMVVMFAWIFDMGLGAVFNTGRFDLGFYVGRLYGLLAASSLLIVLLIETGAHYARIALLSAELRVANEALEARSLQTANELQKYRGLLEAVPDAMVVVNRDREIVLLNVQAEKQFGYRSDELLGQKIKTLIPDGFAERLTSDGLRSAEVAAAQQIGSGMELRGQRKDGTTFPIEIMLSPLDSADGALMTIAIRDLTARKAAEAHLIHQVNELNRSNEELGQFAYIASHDLQEPLRMVASYTQLLARRYKGKLDSDADEFIAFAVDGATRMQRLIQDLLAFSRVGSKGKNLRNISSDDALQEALVNLRGAIRESGALVTHDALPIVMADETQLTQLFQNLVGNAIKYQNGGVPSVHVAAVKNDGEKWTFSVRDNGLGIDPQHFERIFGMFQRLHKREEFAGTGIGLAICKKIVERHGGKIWVESQAGQGSTFRFALADGGITSSFS